MLRGMLPELPGSEVDSMILAGGLKSFYKVLLGINVCLSS